MTIDNVVTEATHLVHPATPFYAFPLTTVQQQILDYEFADQYRFDDEDILYLQNHLFDVAFHENLTTNEFIVLSLVFRASIGQGHAAANFCFLYYPEFPETSHSIMKGLGEKAFTEAFDSLMRRRLIKRVDMFGDQTPPESFVYDNRQHYWQYAPALTYVDLRAFFRDFCSDDPFFKTYPIIQNYCEEIGALEYRIVQMLTADKIKWHMEELSKHFKIPAGRLSQHKHLILLDLAK